MIQLLNYANNNNTCLYVNRDSRLCFYFQNQLIYHNHYDYISLFNIKNRGKKGNKRIL